MLSAVDCTPDTDPGSGMDTVCWPKRNAFPVLRRALPSAAVATAEFPACRALKNAVPLCPSELVATITEPAASRGSSMYWALAPVSRDRMPLPPRDWAMPPVAAAALVISVLMYEPAPAFSRFVNSV